MVPKEGLAPSFPGSEPRVLAIGRLRKAFRKEGRRFRRKESNLRPAGQSRVSSPLDDFGKLTMGDRLFAETARVATRIGDDFPAVLPLDQSHIERGTPESNRSLQVDCNHRPHSPHERLDS